MRLILCLFVLATALLSAFAFVPLAPSTNRVLTQIRTVHHKRGASIMLDASSQDYGELAKTAAIVLALGGGLIPASIAANKAMIGTLIGSRRGGDDVLDETKDASKSLDPTITDTKNRQYVANSGASGPILPNSSLLFAQEDIPLVDVIAVLGRISDVNSIADWENLPSTRLENVSTTSPPMWLPRGAFKVNMRKAKWLGWPVDPRTGEPVGGQELKRQEEGRISKTGASIGDAALDAVWDTWAWGASISTPDKVDRLLRGYRPNAQELDINKFVSSAIAGRSVTGLAALTFIVIQLVVYLSLFIAPFLREFANVDIGLGDLGNCDPETCLRLFQ